MTTLHTFSISRQPLRILLLTVILTLYLPQLTRAFPTNCNTEGPAVEASQVTGSVKDNYMVMLNDTIWEPFPNQIDFNVIRGQTYNFQIIAPSPDLYFHGYAIILGETTTNNQAGILTTTAAGTGQPISADVCPSSSTAVQTLTNTSTTSTINRAIQVTITLLDGIPLNEPISLVVTLLLQDLTNSSIQSYYYSGFSLVPTSPPSTSTTTRTNTTDTKNTNTNTNTIQQNITISFKVSNLNSITDPETVRSNGIDASWPVFAQQVVSDTTQQQQDGLFSNVTLLPDSSIVQTIQQIQCETSTDHQDATCHDVTASYTLLIPNQEVAADVEQLYFTSTIIAIDNGQYQTVLDQVTEGSSPIRIGSIAPDPSTAAPTTASPTTSSPTTSAPTTSSPITMSPTTASPTSGSLPPTTSSPTTASPTSSSPITMSPTTASPITGSPTTSSPTTGSPTTTSPTTASPVTSSPTTGSPTTASPTTGSTITASPTTASPTTAAPSTAVLSVLDVVTSSPDHTRWAQAMVQSNVQQQQQQQQQEDYTLFAPTDDGVNSWGGLNKLLQNDEWRYHLIDLVLYHTTLGRYTNLQLVTNPGSYPTPNNFNADIDVAISGNNNALRINDRATVSSEILATNGIVHVIDQVLLPPSVTSNIIDFVGSESGSVVNAARELSMLASLLTRAGLDQILSSSSSDGPFTLWAPNNDAFAKMDQEELGFLTEDGNQALLVDVLNYHVAEGIYTAQELQQGQNSFPLLMLNGKNATISLDGGSSYNIESAQPLLEDVLLNNGVVHVIDTVLVPIVTRGVNLECAEPDTGVACTTDFSPVSCGDFNCTYENECLANSAGFQECTPLETVIPTESPVASPPAAATVWDIIDQTTELERFQVGLQELNINLLLNDGSMAFTVFSPLDDATQNSGQYTFYSNNVNDWNGHLTKLLEHHIILGAYTEADLFNSAAPINSVAGEALPIDTTTRLVGGHQVTQADLVANNGMVHVLDGVLLTSALTLSLVELLERGLGSAATMQRQLQTTGEEFSQLLEVVRSTGLINDNALNERSQDGTTLIAPIDISEDIQTNARITSEDLLLYHLLETNLYKQNFDRGSQRLMATRHPSAQVWVTMDEEGVMRFNDVISKQEVLGENGVLQVVDDALKPPTVADLVHHTSMYTNFSVSIIDSFLQASGWASNEDLFTGSGADGRITLLAPADDAWDTVNAEVQDRLVMPSWSLHLQDLLRNLMLPEPYSKEGLRGLAEPQSLAGTTITVGPIRDPAMQATNGVIHLVTGFDLPASMTNSVLDLIENNNTMAYLVPLINAADLSDTLSSQSQVTFLAPPEAAWSDSTETSILDALQNHIFLDLLYAEQLIEMDGQVITSMNNKGWLVEVLGESVFLKSENDDSTMPPVMVQASSDVLGRNGVLHSIDGTLLDEKVSEAPSGFPSVPPSVYISATSLRTPQPTIAPTAVAVEEIVTINATFLIFNTDGLVSTDVSQIQYAMVLNEAFGVFVEELVNEVEGQQTQRQRQLIQSRQLEASLEPNSAIIYGVRGLVCPTDEQPPIPSDAQCQIVYGRFDLAVINESTTAVQERYVFETEKALEEGKLQEILERTDPDSPFVVQGTAPEIQTSNPTTMPSSDGRGRTQAPSGVTSGSTPAPSAATSSPTGSAPTASPSSSPSSAPSANPTEATTSPTSSVPTQAPVLVAGPTATPSVNGTTAPTQVPLNPTQSPSAKGTDATQAPMLTPNPTLNPTSAPSANETAPTQTPVQTSEPTSAPTSASPTQAPLNTFSPTTAIAPTATPSAASPTEAPLLTSAPSTDATVPTQPPVLTFEPTTVPTVDTSSPTQAPLITSSPTSAATFNETSPTEAPAPTAQPTSGAPTPEPTTKPPLRPPPTENPTAVSTNQTLPPAPEPTSNPTGNVTLVRVNTTFLMYNTEGLTSEAVSEPQNVVTLNRAFNDFVTRLVDDVEANRTLSQRYLRAGSLMTRRRLEVVLQPRSTAVYGVRDVTCPSNHQPPIPDDATCQNVYGKYNLSVTDDEDPDVVHERYVNETEKALAEGKMQESIERTDPDYPFIVFGPADTDGTTAPEPTEPPVEEDDDKMEWWLILIIVLSCVLGLCCIGFAIAYYCLRQKQSTAPAEDVETGAKLVDEEDDPTSRRPPDLPNTVIADSSYLEKATDTDSEGDDEFEDEDDDTFSDQEDDPIINSVIYSKGEETRIEEQERHPSRIDDPSTVVNIEVEELNTTDDDSEPDWEDEDDDDDDEDEERRPPFSPAYSMPRTVVQDSFVQDSLVGDDASTENLEAQSYWDDGGDSKKEEWIGDDATAQIDESFADEEDVEFESENEDSDVEEEASHQKKQPFVFSPPSLGSRTLADVLDDDDDEYAEDPPMISKFGDAPSAHPTMAETVAASVAGRDPSLYPGDDPSVTPSIITSIAFHRQDDPSLCPEGGDPSVAPSLMSTVDPRCDPSLCPEGGDPSAAPSSMSTGYPRRDPSLCPGEDPSVAPSLASNGAGPRRDPSICPPGEDPSVSGLYSVVNKDDPSAVGGTMHPPETLLEDPNEDQEEDDDDHDFWQDENDSHEEQATQASSRARISVDPVSVASSSRSAPIDESNNNDEQGDPPWSPPLSVVESVATVYDEDIREVDTAASTLDPPLSAAGSVDDAGEPQLNMNFMEGEEQEARSRRQDPPLSGAESVMCEEEEGEEHEVHINVDDDQQQDLEEEGSSRQDAPLSVSNSDSDGEDDAVVTEVWDDEERQSVDDQTGNEPELAHRMAGAAPAPAPEGGAPRSSSVAPIDRGEPKGEMDTSDEEGEGWEDEDDDDTDEEGSGIPSTHVQVPIPFVASAFGSTSDRKRGFLESSDDDSELEGEIWADEDDESDDTANVINARMQPSWMVGDMSFSEIARKRNEP